MTAVAEFAKNEKIVWSTYNQVAQNRQRQNTALLNNKTRCVYLYLGILSLIYGSKKCKNQKSQNEPRNAVADCRRKPILI